MTGGWVYADEAAAWRAAADKATSRPLSVPYRYRARVDRVVDADTLDLVVDLGFHMHTVTRFRLYGIDAWEMRGSERPKGLIATAFVKSWTEGHNVRVEWPLIIDSHKDRQGKYGRWLADIWRTVDGRNLADDLIANGHGEPRDY